MRLDNQRLDNKRLESFQDACFKTIAKLSRRAIKTHKNFSRRVSQDAKICCCQDAYKFFKTCASRRSFLLLSRRSKFFSRRVPQDAQIYCRQDARQIFQDVSLKTLKFVAVKTLENFSRRVRQDASFLCCQDACKFFKTPTINFQDGVSRRSICCQDA